MSSSKKRKLDSPSSKLIPESPAMNRISRASELNRLSTAFSTSSEDEISSALHADLQSHSLPSPESESQSETEDYGSEDLGESESTEIDLTQVAEVPFTISYVQPESKPHSKKARKATNGKKYVWPKRQSCMDLESMDVHYKILPSAQWEPMKSYSSFIIFEQTFRVGEYLYINHSGLRTGATLLAPDERSFWVCQVLEIKAADEQHVYARVFWLYWPSELPSGGRRAHHGKHELLMSNHMEIIDVLTVAGRVNMTHWDENVDDDDGETGGKPLEGLYWRQYFNWVTGRLSDLRTHCVCKAAYNPDSVLVACPKSSCGIWMHDYCLIEDALVQHYTQQVPNDAIELKKLKEYREMKMTASAKKKGRKPSIPWNGKLAATLDPNSTPVKAMITDLQSDEKIDWEKDLVCLSCKASLD